MGFRTLKLQPGVNLVESAFLNVMQAATSNLIRYYGAFIQKLGGWIQMTTQTFVGTCRGLHGWADIVGNPYLAIGTDQRLEILLNGTIVDITPIAATDNIGVDFSTVQTSSTVTIVDASNAPEVGDWINLATHVSVGGIVLFGYYIVTGVIDGTHYTVNAGVPATATVNDGGAVSAYTTISTQSAVTVHLANHGLATGAVYTAGVSTTIATLTIFGVYSVTFVDADHFTIPSGGVANASTTISENSGNARIAYLIPSGTPTSTAVSGFGAGDYGGGDYGGDNSGDQIIVPGRQWSLDHFGQDLIASPSRGGIYYWQPPTVAPALVLSPTAPLFNIAVFVMPQAQIIVSLGAEIGDTLQPLLVRWCDDGDFTDWDASATNQAGSYNIPTGSTLVGGLAVGLGALIWTDNDVWSITYLGFPLVFGFNNIGPGCGLIAQRAVGSNAAFIMWLGSNQQWFQASSGGGVQPIECSVYDFYINNVDFTNLPLIFCAVNSLFNEMAWHFPIATTSPLWNALTQVGYVKYNYVEKVWDYGISGQYQRTAWTDRSPAGNPIGADFAGLLQEHERGRDANGTAMGWSWNTGFFELSETEDFVFSDFLIPDFVTIGQPEFVCSIQTTDYPNQAVTSVVNQVIATGTSYFITYSARGRYMSIGFSGPPSDVGTFNRLGGVRIRISPDGQN